MPFDGGPSPAGDYPGNVVETWSPGAFVPANGGFAGYESDVLSLHWAIASQGMIQMTQRYVWSRFKRFDGPYPGPVCRGCGMIVSKDRAVLAEGMWWHPHCAPTLKPILDDSIGPYIDDGY